MRNKRLDILRCVAVVAVIIHHSYLSRFLLNIGWVGVDLFFILSGFLISGLLFSEYKKFQSIDLRRFLIRRGLKIYPSFYLFLFLAGVAQYHFLHVHQSLAHYLHEVFFLMNYQEGVWGYTWSLAVEEHFYIFLPVFLLLLVKFSPNRQNPFRILPVVTLAIGILCVIFRAVSICVGAPNFQAAYFATHNRMDALFFGVLLGYFYHFRSSALEAFMRRKLNQVAIALASVALVSFAYLLAPLEQRKLLSIFGYTFVYLGFGGVLLLSLYTHGILPKGITWFVQKVGGALAAVGVYSYSIYLWHGAVAAGLPGLLRRLIHFPNGAVGIFAVYFVGSFAVGITMSRMIEYPILRFRDRLFSPSPASPVATDGGLAHQFEDEA